MQRKSLAQETLKWIACVTMLIDHIGAVFLPGYGLRIIGRISFPIFCFLLAEGARHTRSPGKYALRLAISAAVSEVPYDLLFYGGIHWQHQSVMVTLLIGLLTLVWMSRLKRFPFLPMLLGFGLAELSGGDYGCWGVALIILFALTAEYEQQHWIQLLAMAAIFLLMNSTRIPVLGIPIQLFGLLAMVPIGLYSGRKATANPWIQRGFYLFYPIHLFILLGVYRYV